MNQCYGGIIDCILDEISQEGLDKILDLIEEYEEYEELVESIKNS